MNYRNYYDISNISLENYTGVIIDIRGEYHLQETESSHTGDDVNGRPLI